MPQPDEVFNPDLLLPEIPNPAAQEAQATQVVNQTVTGAISSIGGLVGPNISIASGAAVNGVQVLLSTGANTLTVSITGVGEMAAKNRIANVALLAMTVSNPPTQAEVQAIANKIDEILTALSTAQHMV